MYDFKSYNLLFIILSKYIVKCLFKESNSEFGVTEAEEAELIKHIRYHSTLWIPYTLYTVHFVYRTLCIPYTWI